MKLDRHELRRDFEAGKALTSVAIVKGWNDDWDRERMLSMGCEEADTEKE